MNMYSIQGIQNWNGSWAQSFTSQDLNHYTVNHFCRWLYTWNWKWKWRLWTYNIMLSPYLNSKGGHVHHNWKQSDATWTISFQFQSALLTSKMPTHKGECLQQKQQIPQKEESQVFLFMCILSFVSLAERGSSMQYVVVLHNLPVSQWIF